jgi:murein DD-endopeptidase MepM/ murein hydrolase activator NlpD
LSARNKKLMAGLLLIGTLIGGIGLFTYYYFFIGADSNSNDTIAQWLRQPESRPALFTDNQERCGDAPFLLPSSGFIGLLYEDDARPYNRLRRHTGLDIFGDGELGTVPIVAAYDGYLTRLDNWFSTVIIRHDDPLQAGRTIWTYYTHMGNDNNGDSYVSEAFPAGTSEVFVEQGALLGYQGDFSGTGPKVAQHLHFSIVLSDEDGNFLSEAQLKNTLDPSPYFGLPLRLGQAGDTRPIRCN